MTDIDEAIHPIHTTDAHIEVGPGDRHGSDGDDGATTGFRRFVKVEPTGTIEFLVNLAKK